MPAGFDTAFARVKELVANFQANEKFYLSPEYQEQKAYHDFQKGTIHYKVRMRINGRCFFKTEALANHGCHSVERQQGHGTEIGLNLSRTRNQRLEAASAVARQPRFCFPPRAAGRICGRLFLAWLPKARANARQQPQLLASEAQSQQTEGQSRFKAIAEFGLARVTVLGARSWQSRGGRQAVGFRIE